MTRATSRATRDGIAGAQATAMVPGDDRSGEVHIHTREQSTEPGPLSGAVVGALTAALTHPLPRATVVTGRAFPRRWPRS
jgi:hypothetical protein